MRQDDTQFRLKFYHITSVEVPKTRTPSFHPKNLGMASVLKEGPSIHCLIPHIGFTCSLGLGERAGFFVCKDISVNSGFP